MTETMHTDVSVAAPSADWTSLTSQCSHCGMPIMVNVTTHAKSVRFIGTWFHRHSKSEYCG
jgi:hypothetical protein